jgi:hypothetical protein
MNLYLICRVGETDYDQYEGAVVVAPSADVALRMHPADGSLLDKPTSNQWNGWDQRLDADGSMKDFRWPTDNWVKPNDIACTLLGPASSEYTEPKVVLASFLAG